MAAELRALIRSNTVRVLDLVVLTKDADDSVEASELRDVDDSDIGQLRELEADLAVLLAEDNILEIGRVVERGSAAAVLVWENVWAGPFGAAVRRSGGQLVTSGHLRPRHRGGRGGGVTCPLFREQRDQPGLIGSKTAARTGGPA